MIAPVIDGRLFPRPIKAYKVVSGAMLPTLQVGDHILADLNAYKTAQPQRGDIALFNYPVDPSKNFVMRVIGLPGEQIEIRDKFIYINGKPLVDAWGVYDEQDSNIEGARTLVLKQSSHRNIFLWETIGIKATTVVFGAPFRSPNLKARRCTSTGRMTNLALANT